MGKLLFHILYGAFEVGVAYEDLAVDVLDAGNGHIGKATAAQAHHVHAHEAQRFACGLYIRRNVLAHQRCPGDEAVRTDADELLHGHVAFQNSPVADGDVPSKVHAVGDHHVVAHQAIVRQMHVGHQQAVLPYGGALPVGGAAVDGDALAHGGAIPDFGGGFFAGEFEVLRNGGDHRAGKNAAVGTDARAVHDGGVGADPRAVADGDIRRDGGERLDHNVIADACIRVDAGQFGNAHASALALVFAASSLGALSRAICAIISASTAGWPFT